MQVFLFWVLGEELDFGRMGFGRMDEGSWRFFGGFVTFVFVVA